MHRHDGLLIMDVHAGLERERGEHRGVHIDEVPVRMIGHEEWPPPHDLQNLRALRGVLL